MADASGQAPSSAKTPTDFLNSIKGKPVIVKLNSGVDYKGEYSVSARPVASLVADLFLNHQNSCADPFAGLLACLDGYMNIAMEQTEVLRISDNCQIHRC
jgi:small nuclear ribonucleoprotein (snRNP)-like protein